MRLAPVIAIAMLATSAPAFAQQSEGGGTREVVNRVLDSLLGPRQQPQEEAVVEEEQQAEAVTAAAELQAALEHPRRAEDSARDQYRHPVETLEFFQVQPGMTVVDFMPSSGWYSRVLIPYLGRDGNYIGLDPVVDDSFSSYWDFVRNTSSRLPRDARGWVGFDGARVYGLNTDDQMDSFAGTADRVLVFREMHNMRRFGWLHDTLVAARTLLKDDGLLGMVQHRADESMPTSFVLGDKGYQRETDVINIMKAYGFDLVARSEVNANPRDPANWEEGVWSLPPSYRGAEEGSEERARRAEIGESDRMTLLFRKRP